MTTTTRPKPEHGTRACYIRGCRRPECRQAHYRYMSRWRLDHHRGQHRRTNAQPAANHINQLAATGWSYTQIAQASGTAHRTIAAIAHGRHRTIAHKTDRRILSVPIGPPPATQYVDATGTRRRIQALVAIGHPICRIAPAVGIHRSALARVANGELQRVLPSTAKATAEVYRAWSTRPGTSVRARTNAARNGWHGPFAWDKNTIDDPAALPDIDDARPGSHAEARLIAAEIQHLAFCGESPAQIARRVGRSEKYVLDQTRGSRGPGWRGKQQQEGAAA